MASKQYNIGIIGYGLSAKTFHIPFIQAVPDLKLHAVVQRSPKPDNDPEKDHPGIKVYRSVEDMLKDSLVDVVLVCTSPESHSELAKAALNAGKHSTYTFEDSGWFCTKRPSHRREAVHTVAFRSR